MSEQMTVPLGSLLEDGQVSYGIVQPGQRVSDGVPIIRVKDIRAGRIQIDEPLRVSPDISNKHYRTILTGGELVMSIVGTVGETAIVPIAMKGWNVARAVAVLRPVGVSAEWLQLALTAPEAKNVINSMLNTTVQATLNLADLKKIPIPMPPTATRSAIAEVLGALDDKIAANDRILSIADELARHEFRTACTDAASIPLSSLARFANGKAYTKHASGTGRVVVRIAELNSGLGSSTVYNDIEVPEDNLVRPGDLLFAWSGSLTAARWYRPEAIVNQHIFKVIPSEGVPMWLVNQAVQAKLAEFTAIAADKTTTMGHIQRRHLDQPVLIPSNDTVKELDPLMGALWSRALAAEVESSRLTKTRDELLPLLMSGKIGVRDAEKQAEALP
jgi:type I restriction enzyme S subunit